MSSGATLVAVLSWALEAAWEGKGSVPPPQAPASSPDELLQPSPELCLRLGQLAAVVASRLRLASPPLGDPRPAQLDAALVALALAWRRHERLALLLLDSVRPSNRAWDWLVRHALVTPAVPVLAPELSETLRALSPLTGVFERPGQGGEGQALAACQRLLVRADGRLALQHGLAAPTEDIAVRLWRARLLNRLRTTPETRAFVLDVYEAALSHHREAHLTAILRAEATLLRGEEEGVPHALESALATAEWWGPLWALERAEVSALRARRWFDVTYRDGLRLYGRSRSLRGL